MSEKLYHVPAPTNVDAAEAPIVQMTESEFIKYRQHLACLAPVAAVPARRKYGKRRTQDQILCDIAHLVPGAMPCAYGPIGRAEMRKLALEKYPNSPLAGKVASRPSLLAV